MLDVAAARARAEAWMRSTITIREPSTEARYDPELGHDVIDDQGAVVYTGKCRVMPTGGERVVRVGEGVVSLRTYNIDVPVGDEPFGKDQLGTIDAIDDGYLLDRVVLVVDVQGMTDGVYRRLVCEDTLTRADTDDEGS